MDFTLHQIAKGFVHQSMAGDGRSSGELGRDDQQAIVSATTLGARVPGVLGRVVNELELYGIESGQTFAQQVFDCRDSLIHAGSTFLNGLTLTAAYTPAAT